jgi:hypothetical protein
MGTLYLSIGDAMRAASVFLPLAHNIDYRVQFYTQSPVLIYNAQLKIGLQYALMGVLECYSSKTSGFYSVVFL